MEEMECDAAIKECGDPAFLFDREVLDLENIILEDDFLLIVSKPNTKRTGIFHLISIPFSNQMLPRNTTLRELKQKWEC